MVLRNMIVFILVYACYRPTSSENWDIFLLEALKIYYFDPCPLADTWHMWCDEIGTALNTSSAENGSVLKAPLPPLPQGELAKETATSWKVETYQNLKQNTWYLQIFLFFFLSCALICVLHLSPLPFLPSSSQAVSINKAINTQEVAVKEKHARNILTLCLCVCALTISQLCV